MTMSTMLQGIIATVAPALAIAVVVGFFRALATLRANTDAINQLDKTLADMRVNTDRAQEAQNARISDLETWRTAVTASLFRFAGEHKP